MSPTDARDCGRCGMPFARGSGNQRRPAVRLGGHQQGRVRRWLRLRQTRSHGTAYLRVDTVEQALREAGTLPGGVGIEGYAVLHRVAAEACVQELLRRPAPHRAPGAPGAA